MYQAFVEARTATLGPDHPHTLSAHNDLARAYIHQGKYDQAGPVLELVLKKRQEVLGVTHHDTLVSMTNLAGHHFRTGNMAAGNVPSYYMRILVFYHF